MTRLGRASHLAVALVGVVGAISACGVGQTGAFEAEEALNTDAGGSADDGDPLSDATPARGISIVEVEINQGTRIPIGFGGEWVDGPERTGFLIASRDSLMRIHYAVDEGWAPREIEARLTLEFPDGSTKSFTDTRFVEHDSNRKNLTAGPFFFGLIADDGQTIAGTRYHVELWETVGGLGEGFEEGDWANPAAGSELIGFESVPMQIKTLLVPITYGGVTAGVDDATLETVVNNLYEQNPATEILWDVHPPVDYPGQLNSLGSLLPVMAELRSDEGADPNVYYHALVDVGSQSLGGTLGISYLANDSKTDGGSRVSATVLFAPDPTIAADTYTHETGHAQGLNHVECPNADSANPDPSYPYANGRIGNWGFGIRRFLMYDPDDAFDYMSYCSPSWVSDWTWNKTYQRIKTLTSWDFEGASGEPGAVEQLLVGAIYPDGTREWWTMPGAVDPRRVSGLDRFEFEVDGELVGAYGDVSVLSDGQTQWVKVALPAAIDELDSITHFRAGDSEAQGEGGRAIEPASLARRGAASARASAWRPSFRIYRP
ncbi:hypothetical protein ENSA5_34170 [Enhygromyxa salina]|uniref:Uncharacterized protein n=1 Tax=Enhygromyxa salina TaxID=215803 RepID=A0A2S9XX37_9BACT|nr:M66 family metalloprotease [Enhygromyxa salina]PRP97425.1 hypothetical protein ENSA5_34170 [Enhygromyxa salina]